MGEKLAPVEAAFVNDKGETETGIFEADKFGQADYDKPKKTGAKAAASDDESATKKTPAKKDK